MENPTLPTNWLAALSNARSEKNLGTLICSPKISHKENVADTRDICDIPNLFTLKNT